MYSKTNTIAAKEKHSANFLQRKSKSPVSTLPAVPVFKPVLTPEDGAVFAAYAKSPGESISHKTGSDSYRPASPVSEDKQPEAFIIKKGQEAGQAKYAGQQGKPVMQRFSAPLHINPTGSSQVVQRTRWVWDGRRWNADGPVNTPYPKFAGGEVGAVFREEPAGEDPYARAETLPNGAIIDYPALIHVMDHVEIGVEVKSSVWRKMREDLSQAITLANKSHPAHGSNFDKNQRPEQQIVDWAAVISGELKERLAVFFRTKYGIYL